MGLMRAGYLIEGTDSDSVMAFIFVEVSVGVWDWWVV